MSKNFSERLTKVLDGRKPTPWGKGIGLNSATTSGLFAGKQPGSEILNAIMRKENVSLSWLLSGKGPQFLINHCQTAEAFYDLLGDLLEEERWNDIYVCNAPNGLTVVLTQPGQYDYKGTPIDYTVIEVLNGPVNDDLIQGLSAEKDIGEQNKYSSHVHFCRLNEQDARDISNGCAGTFDLFGDSNTQGILEYSSRTDYLEDLVPTATTPTEAADPQLLRAVIEQFEKVLIEEGITLTASARARAITAMYRHAAKTSEVDPLVALAIIEASAD